MRLKDNVVIVTGAGRGIGRAIAERFAQEGANVVLAARTKEEIEGTRARVVEAGGRAIAVPTDISNRASVDAMVARATAEWGRVDVLVCNASVFKSMPFLATEDELWRRIIDVNLHGTALCMKAVLPGMMKNGYGRIIAISSVIGKMGLPFYSAYSASKHAIIGLTKCVAREVARSGVTVNAICPGMVETAMKEQFVSEDAQLMGISADEYSGFLLRLVPQGRFLEPVEVADLAVYMASREAHGMTAQAVNICGGASVY